MQSTASLPVGVDLPDVTIPLSVDKSLLPISETKNDFYPQPLVLLPATSASHPVSTPTPI